MVSLKFIKIKADKTILINLASYFLLIFFVKHKKRSTYLKKKEASIILFLISK